MTYNLFVPGRLCLFGEHSDWAGQLRSSDNAISPGACLITGTDQGLRARATASDAFEFTTTLPDGTRRDPVKIPFEAASLAAAATDGGFFSYAAGTALTIRNRFSCGGVAIDVHSMDLPIGRGLSSSAAVCVLTARAFNVVYDLGLGVLDEMEVAFQGERAAGSQCGRMDQACAYGKRPVLLRFDGDTFDVEPLTPGGPLYLMVVDLLATKDTRRILSDLHREFAVPDRRLREALGKQNLEVIAGARGAIERGDAQDLGFWMARAQRRFDRGVAPCSYTELRSPRLHTLLTFGPAADLTWGGKGVGSQGDGCAQFICRGPAEREELARQIHAAGLGRCIPLTIGV